jgi:hypothetical protein
LAEPDTANTCGYGSYCGELGKLHIPRFFQVVLSPNPRLPKRRKSARSVTGITAQLHDFNSIQWAKPKPSKATKLKAIKDTIPFDFHFFRSIFRYFNAYQ